MTFPTVFGVAGLCLCLANYWLLTRRRGNGSARRFILLNHVAAGAMLSGLTISHGAGVAVLLAIWLSVAALSLATLQSAFRPRRADPSPSLTLAGLPE